MRGRARARPRLAQCLAVFFPALASAPPDRRRLVADAALPCLRALSAEKGVARVGAYLAHLLDHAAAARANGDAGAETAETAEDVVGAGAPRSRAYVAGGADLLRALCEEALATVSSVSAAATTTERALAKAYVATLASLALAAPVAPAFTVADYDEKSVARATLVAAAEAAEAAAAKSTQKIASRDLKLAAVKARKPPAPAPARRPPPRSARTPTRRVWRDGGGENDVDGGGVRECHRRADAGRHRGRARDRR